MKNIHDDFFDSKNQSNKRKNTSDSPQQKKKFIGDGSRKRNLDQNEERKKIKIEIPNDHVVPKTKVIEDLKNNLNNGQKLVSKTTKNGKKLHS